MGFRRCVMPEANLDARIGEALNERAAKVGSAERSDGPGSCELVGVRTVSEALDALL
jgi:hypothetical protein